MYGWIIGTSTEISNPFIYPAGKATVSNKEDCNSVSVLFSLWGFLRERRGIVLFVFLRIHLDLDIIVICSEVVRALNGVGSSILICQAIACDLREKFRIAIAVRRRFEILSFAFSPFLLFNNRTRSEKTFPQPQIWFLRYSKPHCSRTLPHRAVSDLCKYSKFVP